MARFVITLTIALTVLSGNAQAAQHAAAAKPVSAAGSLWHSFCVEHPQVCWRRHGR